MHLSPDGTLRYFPDGELMRIRPVGVFIVDGIFYRPGATGSVECVRPMIQILCDDGFDGANMYHSSPPTETELNHFVQGTPIPD